MIAQIRNFIALGRGQLSVIIPLLNTTPLFTVLFSLLFLRDLETVNSRIIFGAILMIARRRVHYGQVVAFVPLSLTMA